MKRNERKGLRKMGTKRGDMIEYHENCSFTEKYEMDKEQVKSNRNIGIYKCVNKETGMVRAVKVMGKNKMDEVEMLRKKYEIDILKRLTHPNILEINEIFEDKHGIYLIME
jgi:hypothetical protein